MSRTSADAAVEVGVDPGTAFRIFTEELDLWWVRGPINHHDSSRLVEHRLEPGVGGRLLEVYEGGDVLETQRVVEWEPGRRLLMRGSVQDTETDVRFEPTASGTRVSVSQYLVPGGDPRNLGFGWVAMAAAYRVWVEVRDTQPQEPRRLERLGVILHYADPPAAARWLSDVFQLGSWPTDSPPAEGEERPWIEFHVGDALVVLRPLDGDPAGAPTHTMWVYVDDLPGHRQHALDRGAAVGPIRSHGSTTYQVKDLEGRTWIFAQAPPNVRE